MEEESSMMRRIAIAAAVACLGGATHAVAQAPGGVSQEFAACEARAGTNTVQSGICAQREMATQDARLNKAYQQVMQQLARDPAKKIALRDEERSWLKQRDYECKVDGQTIDSGCLVRKTAARADVLENQIRF
jgi:uncharacterized protein YecT (DUF1311 family)